jgi:hypothetical protein
MIHATIEQLTKVANLSHNQVKALKEFEAMAKRQKAIKRQLIDILNSLDQPIKHLEPQN